MPRFLRRPLPAALAIGLIAQALFCWRLTTPHQLVFDEIHYVPAARTLLTLGHPANIEHPLLGKILIALGIRLFGDGPLGWRILSTVAASAVVTGSFAILWLVFHRLRTATIGALLVMLNFTVFVQARIAMLDGFLAAFVVLAIAAMLWSARGEGAAVWWRWVLGAILLGVAVACKWAAVPYLAFAAAAFVAVRRRHPAAWPGLPTLTALALLGVASGVAYLLTFAPAFFYADEPLTLATLIPFQATMYAQQVQVLPHHVYQSAWYGWPLMLRPIWYFYEMADGAQRGILLLGNPAVMWGGLVAVAACLWAGGRGNGKAGAIGLLWLGSYLIWAIIPKSLGFYYYYYLPSIWLPLAIAAAFDRERASGGYWDEAFVLAAAVLFIHFYPILSAAPLAGPQAFHRWMWFGSWV